MGKTKTYAQVLKAEMEKADSAPISGGKTREQLKVGIEEITATLSGPLDNVSRIGLAADRRQLMRELEALGERE